MKVNLLGLFPSLPALFQPVLGCFPMMAGSERVVSVLSETADLSIIAQTLDKSRGQTYNIVFPLCKKG